MTSQINPNNIDGTFPVAGQDNSSQGFRDNFTNTKNNFQFAYTEISALQANAVLRGQTNDLGGSVISGAAFVKSREVNYDHGVVTSGAITYSFANGSYQLVQLGSNVTVTFDTDFAAITDKTITIRLEVYVPNMTYSIQWPSSVSRNLYSIANTSGQITRFAQTGRYVFQLVTSDGGVSWNISEQTRNRSILQGNVGIVANVANVSTTGISMTVSQVGGSVFGEIRANSIVVDSVTSSGTNATYSGNVTAGNIIANTAIYGTINTPIQSNITLIGTQTSLSVSGNANVGNLTTTGMTDMCGGTQYGIQFVPNAVNGASTQIWSNIGTVIIQPNAVIASYTITMPATPVNGQVILVMFANTVTSLTQTSSGAVVNGKFTTANANVGGQWMYHTTTNTWYKMN
jgi:hypothetical protein